MKKAIILLLAMALLTATSAFAATTGNHDTNVTILGNATGTLTIISVTPPASASPTEYTTTAVTTTFIASDLNGWDSVNVSTANCRYNKTGETTRISGACSQAGSNLSLTDINITCTANMQYYDATSLWGVNCSVSDINTNYAENITETFTYNSLSAMQLNYSYVQFGSLNPGVQAEATTGSPFTTVNTGNNAFAAVSVTAKNLTGVSNPAYSISGSAFKIGTTTSDYAGATQMVAYVSTSVTGATLARGALPTGTRDLFYYVLTPSTYAQAYSANGANQWVVIAS